MAIWRRYERLIDSTDDNCRRKVLKFVWTNALLLSTVVSISLAIFVGVLVSLYTEPDRIAILLVSLPGEVFLNMLKMIIVPLIIFSVMSGIGSLDLKSSLSLLWRTLLYYMSTTVAAVALGLGLVLAIAPGVRVGKVRNGCQEGSPNEQLSTGCANLTVADSIADLFRNLFPENIISATIFQKHTTCDLRPKPLPCQCTVINSSLEINNITCDSAQKELYFYVESSMSPNILGIIVFSGVLAVVLASMGSEGRRVIQVVSILNDAVLKLVNLIMIYSPIGIFFLIIGQLLKIDDLSSVFAQLGLYMVTVIVGLVVHGCIVLPLVYVIVARRNPLKLVYGVLEAMLTALSTSSSSATLPITLKCLEDKMKFDKRITRFMIPIGATFNMDGTALYEAVAAIFIAQMRYNDQPDFGKILLISITATLAAIGAAGVPQAGLVTMVIVLTSVGLPTSDIAVILVVDWFLDRLRTIVNVFGDCVGCGVICRHSGRFLPPDTEGVDHGRSNSDAEVDPQVVSSTLISDHLEEVDIKREQDSEIQEKSVSQL